MVNREGQIIEVRSQNSEGRREDALSFQPLHRIYSFRPSGLPSETIQEKDHQESEHGQ
jgi:hypothetical protein